MDVTTGQTDDSRWWAEVVDEGLRARFLFRREGVRWALEDLEISSSKGVPLGALRGHQLTAWQRAAEQALSDSARAGMVGTIADALRESPEVAELIEEGYGVPLEEVAGFVLQRLLQRKERKAGRPGRDLSVIARQYEELIRKGVRDPAKAIARSNGVAHQTARNWISRARREGLLGDFAPAQPLRPRDVAILQGFARGLSTKEVAQLLGIEPETVKAHVRDVLKKLGVEEREGARQ